MSIPPGILASLMLVVGQVLPGGTRPDVTQVEAKTRDGDQMEGFDYGYSRLPFWKVLTVLALLFACVVAMVVVWMLTGKPT